MSCLRRTLVRSNSHMGRMEGIPTCRPHPLSCVDSNHNIASFVAAPKHCPQRTEMKSCDQEQSMNTIHNRSILCSLAGSCMYCIIQTWAQWRSLGLWVSIGSFDENKQHYWKPFFKHCELLNSQNENEERDEHSLSKI